MTPAATELSIADRDFRPVPLEQRERTARIPNVSTRLYVDRVVEHREVFEFIKEMLAIYGEGEGTKTIVRALLHYRDTVIGTNGRMLAPDVALRDFRPVPPDERPAKPISPKGLSARLRIDQWQEHRDAFQFIQDMQNLHGDGGKTLVRALLHYRDTVIRPRNGLSGAGQLSLDVPGLRPRR